MGYKSDMTEADLAQQTLDILNEEAEILDQPGEQAAAYHHDDEKPGTSAARVEAKNPPLPKLDLFLDEADDEGSDHVVDAKRIKLEPRVLEK